MIQRAKKQLVFIVFIRVKIDKIVTNSKPLKKAKNSNEIKKRLLLANIKMTKIIKATLTTVTNIHNLKLKRI